MAAQMGILSYGAILTFTAVLTGSLSIPAAEGNAIDQRVLQRDLGEGSSEIMSLNDKDDFREIDEPAVNGYAVKTKNYDQTLENALIDYLFTKQMMNKIRARTDSFRAQKKRNYWKQCAFNAVSCFG